MTPRAEERFLAELLLRQLDGMPETGDRRRVRRMLKGVLISLNEETLR